MVHARGRTPRLIDHPLLTMARPAVGPSPRVAIPHRMRCGYRRRSGRRSQTGKRPAVARSVVL